VPPSSLSTLFSMLKWVAFAMCGVGDSAVFTPQHVISRHATIVARRVLQRDFCPSISSGWQPMTPISAFVQDGRAAAARASIHVRKPRPRDHRCGETIQPTTGKSVGKPRPVATPVLRTWQPTTGKSVGKPRPAKVIAAYKAEPTTGKSVGKPRHLSAFQLHSTKPTTGKSVGKPRRWLHAHVEAAEPTTGKSVGKPRL
jgi:hypothetical protein